MSSSGADASADATKIAGLDLDDELQQLLKEQEEFLKQSKRPAAKVSRVGGARSTSAAAAAGAAAPTADATSDDADADTPSGPQVLGSVVERDVIELNIRNVNVMPRVQANGFPAVQRRGESLFGKRQRQPGAAAAATGASAKPSRFSAMKKAEAASASSAPMDSEQAEIDRTNRARLQEMSLDEIREAQQELMASLDPALVAKLMSKKKNKQAPAKESSSASRSLGAGTGVAVGKAIVPEAEAAPPAAPIDLAKITSEDELHAQAALLPPDERAKHEWMTSVSTPAVPSPAAKTPLTRKAKLEASTERFGFDGQRIATDAGAIPTHSGLFHHGDEPDAAGYTMPELVHLARSTVASQRAMALTLIAKVLRLRAASVATGDLTRVFPRVLPTDLPITLRIALDDQNYTALSAAVSALHAFLVPATALDRNALDVESRYGVVVAPPQVHVHPNVLERRAATSPLALALEASQTNGDVVIIDTTESPEDGSVIADEDLTFLDPVQGFLHMDIGTRLRFILESIQLPDPRATAMMLDVLAQIAAHSPFAAKALGTNAKLMKAIERQFIANDAVLTLQDDATAALELTHKALVLVRTLCQGSRAVASVLIATGVVQSTKGFLAVQHPSTPALYDAIQLESLRLWRVLLLYGLDFNCFAYLFPILCGFRGADLVRPTRESPSAAEDWTAAATGTSLRLQTALFAALEAFCSLATVHDAQHYFAQFGYFVAQAHDTVTAYVAAPDAQDAWCVVAAAIRFLAAAAPLARKFHLDERVFARVFTALREPTATALLTSVASSTAPLGREVLTAIVHLQHQVLTHGLLADDVDDEDVTRHVVSTLAPHVLASLSLGVAPTPLQSNDVPQLCHLVTLASDLVAMAGTSARDDAFAAALYAHGLALMTSCVRGHECWLSALLHSVLFAPTMLERVGLFTHDAPALSRVLIPIYHALVTLSSEHEAHAQHVFGSTARSSVDKQSCHLVLPQDEATYSGSSLPLPSYWLYAPFSRMEVPSASAPQAADVGPTRAESDELKLIVSATCRYVSALERARHERAGLGAWQSSNGTETMDDADKLCHVLHVFFAGADVLFDPHVDTALRAFVPAFAVPVVERRSATGLFASLVRHLRDVQHVDVAPTTSDDSDASAPGMAFASDEQLVLTFVEKLVAEFTSSSFGHDVFARCVALLLASDFPLAIRKFVWLELASCRLLHALAPFASDEHVATATLAQCTQGALVHDAQWLQSMAHALCHAHVSPTRGAFAYRIALHHVTLYLFGTSDGAMSFARQQLAHELVAHASATVWHDVLRYDARDSADATAQARRDARVLRMTHFAGLSPEQLAQFMQVCERA